MNNESTKVIKGSIFHFIASFINQILNIFKNFYIAKLLDISSFGILNKGLLFVDYSTYFNLGGNQAFAVLFSKLKGENKLEEAQELKFYGIISNLFSLPFFILIAFLIIILDIKALSDNFLVILLLTIYSFILLNQQFFSVILRGDQKYYLFSMTGLLINVITISLLIMLGTSITIISYLFILIFCVSTISIYLYLKSNLSFNYQIKKDLLFDFIKQGLLINLSNFIIFIFLSLDRFFATNYLNNSDFAIFSFALITIKGSSLLTNSVSTILFPSIVKKFASFDDKSKPLLIVNKINYLLLILNSVILFAYCTFLPLIIINFLDKYFVAIKYMIFLSPIIIFNSLPVSNYDIILASGKQKYIITSLLIIIIFFSIILILLNNFFDLSLEYFIIISNLISLIYANLVLFIVKNQFTEGYNILKEMLKVMFFALTPIFIIFLYYFLVLNLNYTLNIFFYIISFIFLILFYLILIKFFFNEQYDLLIFEIKKHASFRKY